MKKRKPQVTVICRVSEYGGSPQQNVGSRGCGKLEKDRKTIYAGRPCGERAGENRCLTSSAQTLFYLRRGMMLKAEREAHRLTERFPEQYQGHHLLFLVMAEKERYEDIENHLKEISEQFRDELQYQLDSLAVLEMQEKNEEYLREAEKMPLILKTFPEMILRKKVETYGKQNDRKAACKAIDELADTYGDPDAVFAKMLLSLADGDYISAGTIANFIMEQEQKKANLRFYLTMTRYLRVFCIWDLTESRMRK